MLGDCCFLGAEGGFHVSRTRRILLGGLAVLIIGVAAGEHGARRAVERRYVAVQEQQRQLEQELEQLRTAHEEASELLEQERARGQELAQALTEKSAQLNGTVGRLVEENRTIQELRARLGAMGQQMDQLQSELSLAIQDVTPQRTRRAGSVQLERVLISSGSGQLGPQGRVVSVDQDWRFVVINLGWSTVKIGDTVSIFRQDELLARAQIERVQEGVAAATILPDWEDVQIEVNDVVRLL